MDQNADDAGAGRQAHEAARDPRSPDLGRRPRLRPGLPRAWRDLTTLQIGLSGGRRGALLAGLQDGDEAVLACLDGQHDLAQVGQVAQRHGVTPWRVQRLLTMLREADLLVHRTEHDVVDRVDLGGWDDERRRRLLPDADAWACVHDRVGDGIRLLLERGRRHVRLDGAGRVGYALAAALTAAGVGTVSIDATDRVRTLDVLPAGAQAQDVGASPSTAVSRIRDRLRASRDAEPQEGSAPARPDLVVLVASHVVDAGRGDVLMRADVPHLAVIATTDRVVVGPLVLPGRGPCLRCLDLHRRDRDPAWPAVVAQLIERAQQDAPRCESALATTAAGVAALQVLAQLDGRIDPASHAHTLEVALPDGLIRRRSWGVHPACGCTPPPWDPRAKADLHAA